MRILLLWSSSCKVTRSTRTSSLTRRHDRWTLTPQRRLLPTHYGPRRVYSSATSRNYNRARSSSQPIPAEQKNGYAKKVEDSQPRKPAKSARTEKKTQDPRSIQPPEIWVNRIEVFLPSQLRSSGTKDQSHSTDVNALQSDLVQAQKDLNHHFGEPIDVLTYMVVEQGRYAAAVFLIDKLLHFAVACRSATSNGSLPSNIQWTTSRETALSQKSGPLDLSFIRRSPSASDFNLEDRYQEIPTYRQESAALAHVWHFLGTIVVRAANSDVEYCQALLTIAYRVLAKLHHMNLVPKNVYSYVPTSLSTTLQRPPVLNLLSSRILTTLSDAVWRSSQDEAISEAENTGIPLQKLGLDPPGGRFRLKVRDLGPEAWLEFILWCCIEGGFGSTGASIVGLIRRQTDDPWFAVSWTNEPTSERLSSIDWDRVRTRTGGTVGRIEGYSSEEPLIQIPSRTVSAEVILALVENLLNSPASARPAGPDFHRGLSLLVGFLEPHSLPAEYFDYLGVRMLQTEELDFLLSPADLHSWFRTISWLRSLETTRTRPTLAMDYRYQSVIGHSELHAGILHQALQAYLRAGFPSEAVEVFNDIQRLVDNSKMQAIRSFISKPMDGAGGFFDARTTKRNRDFVDAHGQLPLHKVAAFLNMVTDNSLVALGEWMLYSDDVDGPIIPRRSYRHPSMATALVRYAGTSADYTAHTFAVLEAENRRMRPTVKYLRTKFDAYVRLLRIQEARGVLQVLVTAQAGGYSPDNLACLASSLLLLESGMVTSAKITAQMVTDTIQEITLLMRDILDHRFDGAKSVFTMEQTTLFQQQIGHLLRIFDNVSSESLNDLAFRYMLSYPSGNQANLKPGTFDIMLKAIVQCNGAVEGYKMWQMFCKSPKPVSGADVPPDFRDYALPTSDFPYEDDSDPDDSSIAVDESILSEAETSIDELELSGKGSTNEPGNPQNDADVAVPKADISFDAGLRELPTFTNDFASSNFQRDVQPTPLVVPSIKTLRIILRGAMSQTHNRHHYSGRRSPHQKEITEVVRWAKNEFRAFRTLNGIKRELQLGSGAYVIDEADEQSVNQASVPQARERSTVDITRNFSPRGFVTNLPWKHRQESQSKGSQGMSS